jgi:hypothetical protein
MVIISGQIEGISSRKDRTWRVTFGTQELDRETAASLTDMANQHVHALIKADMITDVEAMAMDDISPDLAPSKRERAVRFIVLPAPVSPVRTLRPLLSSSELESIIPKFRIDISSRKERSLTAPSFNR